MFVFGGLNTNSFTDISYAVNNKKHTLISGLNIVYDKFKQKANLVSINQTTQSFTTGVYIQDTWDASEKIKIESGKKIAQAVLCPVVSGKWVNLVEKDDLGDKDRNNNGFGSTGL